MGWGCSGTFGRIISKPVAEDKDHSVVRPHDNISDAKMSELSDK
jgi:hypothetical protein